MANLTSRKRDRDYVAVVINNVESQLKAFSIQAEPFGILTEAWGRVFIYQRSVCATKGADLVKDAALCTEILNRFDAAACRACQVLPRYAGVEKCMTKPITDMCARFAATTPQLRRVWPNSMVRVSGYHNCRSEWSMGV